LAASSDDDKVRIFDVATLAVVATAPGGGHGVAFSSRDRLLATSEPREASIASPEVALWDVEQLLSQGEATQGQQLATISFTTLSRVTQFAFAPGKPLLALTGTGIEIWDIDRVLNQGEVSRWDQDARIDLPDEFINTTAPIGYSADGRYLVTGGDGLACQFMVWDTDTWERQSCIGSPNSNLTQSIRFSLDNTLVITGAEIPNDRKSLVTDIRLWDAQSGELLKRLEEHFENYNALTLSPDGRLLASAGGGFACGECPSYDGTIRLWGVVP
jgi:WD40 repeat protein